MHNRINLIHIAIHASLCDHLWCDLFSLQQTGWDAPLINRTVFAPTNKKPKQQQTIPSSYSIKFNNSEWLIISGQFISWKIKVALISQGLAKAFLSFLQIHTLMHPPPPLLIQGKSLLPLFIGHKEECAILVHNILASTNLCRRNLQQGAQLCEGNVVVQLAGWQQVVFYHCTIHNSGT